MKSTNTLKSRYKQYYEEEAAKASLRVIDELNCEEKVQLKVDGQSHRFTDDVRLTYMVLQGEGNVSAENCSKVVQIVSKHLFKKNFSDKELPSSSSSLNFMSEANILAQHHATESILNSKHFTFACDATSRQKRHYLEQHIQLDNGQVMSLGYTEIASDDSQTLLETCIDAFKNLSSVYCEDEERDHDVVFKEIIEKMKCLMSDRAAVMKCFDAKMAAFKDELLGKESSTHFIFCNAHFLLGLSAAAGVAAKNLESEQKADGEKHGRDANSSYATFQNSSETAANRIIRTAAEVLGPRQEWLAYMSSVGKKSLFSSFRSNRFNNVFHNATALLYHQHDRLFLVDYMSHSNLKLESILLDLKDDRIMASIAAISFFHEFFTEPYWQLMNSSKSYGHFPNYVKDMESSLQTWASEEFNLMTGTSVFQHFFSSVPFILDFLKSGTCDLVQVKSNLKEIVKQSAIVFKRQLCDFLEGGVFGGEIGVEVQNILNTCPMTNLIGERLFGDLDFDMFKRRNASLQLRSSLNMWKHNKTSKWMIRQTDNVRKRLVNKAIKLATDFRKRSREKQRAVLEKVKKRIAENKRKKDEKAIKEAEKRASLIDTILSHGGICNTKNDVDELMSRPNALENLKAQIRYRKLCKGENIQITGNVKTLYARLLKHIENE